MVALKEDPRVVPNPLPFEFLAKGSHAVVHRTEHGGHNLAIPRPIREPIQIVLRRVHRVIRRMIRPIQQEGSGLRCRLANVPPSILGHHFRKVLAIRVTRVAVVPQVVHGIQDAVWLPIINGRIVINAAGHEPYPCFEAMGLGSTLGTPAYKCPWP
jgi:hypothetical protein